MERNIGATPEKLHPDQHQGNQDGHALEQPYDFVRTRKSDTQYRPWQRVSGDSIQRVSTRSRDKRLDSSLGAKYETTVAKTTDGLLKDDAVEHMTLEWVGGLNDRCLFKLRGTFPSRY